jgi:hypothetical protein
MGKFFTITGIILLTLLLAFLFEGGGLLAGLSILLVYVYLTFWRRL